MNRTSIFVEKNRQGMLHSYMQEVIEFANPEKVFLLSATCNYQFTEDIFLKTPVVDLNTSKYGLFILYDARENSSLLKERLKNFSHLSDQKHHQLEFMDIHEFNKKIETGDKRLTHVLLSGMLWFDKGKIPLSDPKWFAEPV